MDETQKAITKGAKRSFLHFFLQLSYYLKVKIWLWIGVPKTKCFCKPTNQGKYYSLFRSYDILFALRLNWVILYLHSVIIEINVSKGFTRFSGLPDRLVDWPHFYLTLYWRFFVFTFFTFKGKAGMISAIFFGVLEGQTILDCFVGWKRRGSLSILKFVQHEQGK